MRYLQKSLHRHAGFTIIELAVALTIMAFIIGGLAIPISTRLAEQQYIDTQASIDKAVEALLGFAVNNHRLPCPDVSTLAADNRDGLEDVTNLPVGAANPISGCHAGFAGIQSAANGASWGDIPWRTLGLQTPANQDAWNNRLRYAVFTPLTTQTATAACGAGAGLSNVFCTTTLPTVPAITAALDIRCANPTSPPGTPAPNCLFSAPANVDTNFVLAQNAVFVVYSHGANGWGSTNANDLTSTKVFLAGTTSNDEQENIPEAQGAGFADATINARRRFVTRARSGTTSNAGEYDDVLTYMSANTFAAKMLAAGVWP
jgi:type II secretory pathway pseudopilin PulG